MSLATLPADIQCQLLSYLPDFRVLNSLLLTSRTFHSVFLTRRDLVLKHVAENFLGLALGDEFSIGECDPANGTSDSNASETIKFLVQAKEAIECLEPIVFRLLIEPDAHWDEPDRCPSLTESTRLRRAACRFAKFCALSSGLQQSRFLARLETIEVFEILHFVDGLRKMVYILFDAVGGAEGDLDTAGQFGRLVSTGPANICRLWNLREGGDMARFHDEMMAAAAGAGTDEDGDGAFDDAYHHFEVSRNLSAFDATRTRALLDVGHQQTEEALSNLESLMVPPPRIPLPRPRRPRFRSLKLPLCDNTNKNSVRLPFLPDDLNSLPIRSHIPYAMLVLNGEPRIMPLSPLQLAELVKLNQMHL
ncbi:hypothetical protein MVEN_00577000 [Mycena venus]|uniref:F-box domain-containing protein n=1 Tax=Mycena venus TaxID=2733690 RepID=A0A8H7D4U3_9AGAR|nr:hypothetical protein MVEN_00577000 [Mycena venus]